MTENSQENSRNPAEHLKEHQWPPGVSGNPGGRPKKLRMTEIYEELLDDPEVREQVKEAIKKCAMGRKTTMAAVIQWGEMAQRVEGKVTQPVEVGGELKITLSEAIRKARERASKK